MLASCRPNLVRSSQVRNTRANACIIQNTASTQGKCNAKHLQTRQGRQMWPYVAGQTNLVDRQRAPSIIPATRKGDEGSRLQRRGKSGEGTLSSSQGHLSSAYSVGLNMSCQFSSFTLDLCSSKVIPVAKSYRTTVEPLLDKTKYGPVLHTNSLLLQGRYSRANVPGLNTGSAAVGSGNASLYFSCTHVVTFYSKDICYYRCHT